MIETFDIGVNLTNKSLLRDLDAVMQRAADAGVVGMAVTGTSIDSSRQAIDLCQSAPGVLVSTCGVHPHHASEWDSDSEQQLVEMAAQQCARAIGETGLDFNRNYSTPQEQEFAFEQQLEIAARLGMPLFCHQRDAHQRFIDILKNHRESLGSIVVHCFTDSRAALEHYLDLDCYIGITGWICDERRGLELQQLVSLIPEQRLLLETDAPYLLPRDLEPKPASKVNEPCYLPHILHAVARHRGQDPVDLGAACLANSRRFFAFES